MPLARWVSDLGPTNPIILRVVSNGSRRARHLWIRSGFLAVLMVALLFGMIGQTSSLRDLAQRGATAFTWLSFVQITLICVLTPLFMAGAIAQESNPRTWEILLTTPLNRVQIVVGNLMGRLFFVLGLLAAALPLMLATQLFGGVPPSAVWGSFALSACTALFVGAVAVALSIVRSAGKRSVFVFYSTVVLYLFATWSADVALRQPIGPGSVGSTTTVLTPLNPFLALQSLLMPSTYSVPAVAPEGWLQVQWMLHPARTYAWITMLLSLVLMAASALSVRSVGVRAVRTPWWRRWAAAKAAGEGRQAMRVWHNSIAWRESQLRGTTVMALVGRWGFVLMGIAGGACIPLLHRLGALTLPGFRLALLTVVTAETVVIVLTALNMSATAVSREREDGSLDIILTTPIQPGPYLWGKLRGLVQFLAPMLLVPTATLGMAAVYVLAGGMGAPGGVTLDVPAGTTTVRVPAMLPEGALEYPLVMLVFTAFAVMVGLQWSIKSKGTIGSAVGAVFATGIVGLVLGMCGLAAGSGIPVAGALLNATTPVNLMMAVVTPEDIAPRSVESGMVEYRAALAVGAVGAAALGGLVVWRMLVAMQASFMFTVRKLAGTA
jgi:ABC-type transport system involved in multi-copper enzyme maturation permease subunit